MHYYASVPLMLFTLPIISTLIGGALAVRFRRYTTLLMAMGAGILLGAAFLDLLPEAIALGAAIGISTFAVLAYTLLSFLLFFIMQSSLDVLGKRLRRHKLSGWIVRRTAAAMLIFHSFRDGMAIGAAYAASHHAGFAVALGIGAHDLGDGMNTVLLTSDPDTPMWSTYLFLLADALAPFLGGLLTVWWVLSARGSVVLLVLAAGFFLEMATGDFIPELKLSTSPRKPLLASMLLGASVVYFANLLIGKVF